jgi:hypothetical protein
MVLGADLPSPQVLVAAVVRDTLSTPNYFLPSSILVNEFQTCDDCSVVRSTSSLFSALTRKRRSGSCSSIYKNSLVHRARTRLSSSNNHFHLFTIPSDFSSLTHPILPIRLKMKSFGATLAFAGAASAVAIQARAAPEAQCCFGINVDGAVSGSVGQLGDGQNRVGSGFGGAQFCYYPSTTSIVDASLRGCIATGPTSQYQVSSNAPCHSTVHC